MDNFDRPDLGDFDDLAPPMFSDISLNDNFDDDDDEGIASFQEDDVFRSAGVLADNPSRGFFNPADLSEDFPDFDTYGESYGKLEPAPHTHNPKFGASDPLSDFQLPLDVATSGPAPPEAPGGYVDPNYHFISNENPYILFDRIATHFDSQSNVDVIVKNEKFKVKCVSYVHGRALCFNVRLYTVDNGHGTELAVEFQRRSGCSFQFAELFRAAKKDFTSTQISFDNRDQFSLHDNMDSILDSLEQVELDAYRDDFEGFNMNESLVVDTLESLQQMCKSPHVDTQLEGLYGLLNMALEGDNTQDLMIQNGIIEALSEANLGVFDEVHRCAVALLAMLSTNRSGVCADLKKSGVVNRLYPLTSSGTYETVRQASKTLLNIAKELGQDAVDEQFREAVDVLTGSYDSVVRQHAAELLDIIDSPQLCF